jgi:hypothetical protein
VPRLDRTKFRYDAVRLPLLYGMASQYRRNLGYGLPGAPGIYVCASSIDYLRYYRSGVPESIEAWDGLRANPATYRPIKVFETHYLNESFYRRLDPMFATYFVSPRIEFYVFVR